MADTLRQMDLTNYPGRIRAINNWTDHDIQACAGTAFKRLRAPQPYLLWWDVPLMGLAWQEGELRNLYALSLLLHLQRACV